MHRLFGKSSGSGGSGGKSKGGKDGEGKEGEGEPPKPTLGDAVGKMDERIVALDTKIKSCDQELLRYKEQLKKAKGPTKESIQKRALTALKRKKTYEVQRDRMYSQQFNMEQTAFAIESVQDTHTTIAAMKEATTTLKMETEKLDLDEIEDMQDDLADLLEEQEEIQDILSQAYATPDGALDEDDLEAELAGLEDAFEGIDIEEDTGVAAAPVSLPSNPSQPATVFTGGVAVGNQGEPSAPVAAGEEGGGRTAVDEFGLPV
jgi:charged multivesicular body protein 5